MRVLLRAFWMSLMFVTTAHASVKVVIYGDEDYPPYSYVKDGQLIGIYAELIHEAAKKLLPEYEVTLKPVPWRRGIDGLKNGYIFALFPPYFSKDRSVFIEQLSHPLNQESVIFMCRESVMHVPRKVFPDDFSGLTIGRNTDFLLSDTFVDAIRDGKITLNETRGNKKNMQKLANDRIDCYANDRLSIWHTYSEIKKNSPEVDKNKMIEAFELSKQNAYIAYSKSFPASYKDDFINKMNNALDSLNTEQTLPRILHKYQTPD